MCEREATIIREPHEACLEPPTEPATYKHQPLSRTLDEIRLIKLHKEQRGPVRCEVEVFPLDHAPEYIALSYRWGPPIPLHDIFVEGQALKIRDMLNSCLLELREDVDTWLWIDQICIAQADTTERNHQVGMMSRIYSISTSVIVWLGDIPMAGPGEIDHFIDKDSDHFNDEDSDTQSVILLMENNYFTRLWIVQEILLARTFKLRINGNRCFSWNTIGSSQVISSPIWNLYINPAPLFLCRFIAGCSINDRYLPLLACIQNFRDSECEDLRNKVYGFMGVVRVEDRIPVDYNKSVFEVYLDVINVVIKNPKVPFISIALIFGHIYGLGLQMELEESLIEGLEPLLEHRVGRMAYEAVNAVGFEKAESDQEHDYWWCEYNSGRGFYWHNQISLPKTRFIASKTAAQIG